ncbi:MAG TPA: response regulator [Verrucomicrobiae bacterium]|nr:response regulator [Verrucomicrobiae bacterium]
MLALLVEANGLVRLELNRALEQEQFEVLWTATTQEAVAAYNRRYIELLLLDLNQPLKVGWDIFEPLGALNPALPIVMVTEKKTELEQTVAERVSTRLEKPFSLRALIQTIHLLLGQPVQTHLQATGSGPISSHSASSQLSPLRIGKQETERNQTYETKSAAGGRRQRVAPPFVARFTLVGNVSGRPGRKRPAGHREV